MPYRGGEREWGWGDHGATQASLKGYLEVISANSLVGGGEDSNLHPATPEQELRPLASSPVLVTYATSLASSQLGGTTPSGPPIDPAPSSLLLLLPAFSFFPGDNCLSEDG